MASGSNTKRNVGIRRLIATVVPPQERNFEANGEQTYVVVSSHGYSHAGVNYARGATIPYDLAAGTLYSNYPKMERDFNARLIEPSS